MMQFESPRLVIKASYMSASGRLLSDTKGRKRPRLCENALNTSKTECREGCLWNQRAKARISLVSDVGVRNAVWAASAAQTASNLRAKRLGSRPDRFKESCDAEDAHHSFEVVGEHMKAHLSAHPRQRFGQEVGTSHPILERSKGCSTVCRRTLIIAGSCSSRTCIASTTASCSQRFTRRSLPVVHCFCIEQDWQPEK